MPQSNFPTINGGKPYIGTETNQSLDTFVAYFPDTYKLIEQDSKKWIIAIVNSGNVRP